MERIISSLRRRYYKMLMSSFVWEIRSSKGKRSWKQFESSVSEIEERIAREITANGIALSSVQELFGDGAHLVEMQREAEHLKKRWNTDASFKEEILSGLDDPTVGKGRKKLFLIPLYGGGWVSPLFDMKSESLRFALSDTILRVVGSYLKRMPRFNSFNLSETVVNEESAEAKFSQRWHRDPEDRKLVKVFVYLSDVEDIGSGPFTYVRGSQEGGKYRHLFPQQFPAGSYPKEGEVESAVDKENIRMCLGKAGTVIFCDTSGLHRGGFSTVKSRMMFTAGFVTDASPHPRRFILPPTDTLKTLPPLASEALSL